MNKTQLFCASRSPVITTGPSVKLTVRPLGTESVLQVLYVEPVRVMSALNVQFLIQALSVELLI